MVMRVWSEGSWRCTDAALAEGMYTKVSMKHQSNCAARFVGKTRGMRLSWRVGLLLAFGPSILSGISSAQSIGPDVSPKIVYALTKRLKPADLDLPTAQLREKLNAIGEDSNLFQVAEDRSEDVPMPGLSKVDGSQREAMAVLEPTGAADSPRLTYWIGVLHGRVGARAIPLNPDRMIGPVYGVWRRRGTHLVGVGHDAVYHSQKWMDAEIYVFKDTVKGPRMDQRIQIEGDGLPFGFVNGSSLTVECRQSAKEDYVTIQAGRLSLPTCEKTWEFQGGRYVLVRTTPNHDQLWAIDRLVTAVSQNNRAVLKAMVPDNSNRKAFLSRLRSTIDHEAINVDPSGEATLVSRRHPRYGVVIQLVKQKSGWVLRNVITKHLEKQ